VTLTTGTGAATGPPVIASYTWAGTPTAGQPFSGTITGTKLRFRHDGVVLPQFGRLPGTAGRAGALNGATSVTVNNVSLAAGSWQIYLVNPGVLISAPSTAFVVLREERWDRR